MARTIRDFGGLPDTWQRIDAWAGQQGFQMVQQLPLGRVYQKGTGVMMAPIMVSVENTATGVRLEGWVRLNTFVRLGWLFLVPEEIQLDSGVVAWLPRRNGRNAVNALLSMLGGQPIA
jgi:hypothetical protein